jgi:hypothetical protein
MGKGASWALKALLQKESHTMAVNGLFSFSFGGKKR